MKIFLDFDRTLYDLDAFHEAARKTFEECGVPREAYDTAKEGFSKAGGMSGMLYTPEAHIAVLESMPIRLTRPIRSCVRNIASDGRQFVFDDVEEFFRETEGHERVIVTFGDDEYQRCKIAGAGLGSIVDDIIVTTEDKWVSMQGRLLPGERAVFVDDHDGYFSEERKESAIYGIHLVREGSPDCTGCFADAHAKTLDEVLVAMRGLKILR